MKNINSSKIKKESTRLRELVHEIGIPLRRLRDILEQTPENCLNWWSNKDFELKIDHKPFHRLTEIVAIDENQLFMGTYDTQLARKRLHGDYNSLPDRYLENQNSFIRTSDHIIRYIILTRGRHFADQVLYKLNVSPLIYDQSDTRINLLYFADLLETLHQCGFSQDELDTLASVMFLSLQNTTLGTKFKSAENVFDVYEILSKNFSYFDSNFEYESHFIGKKYLLKTTLPMDEQRPLLQDAAKIQRLMRYRHILLAWFPFLAGMSPLFPKITSQKLSGAIEVEYELDLSSDSMRPKRPRVV